MITRRQVYAKLSPLLLCGLIILFVWLRAALAFSSTSADQQRMEAVRAEVEELEARTKKIAREEAESEVMYRFQQMEKR
jgi:hypothetical protein